MDLIPLVSIAVGAAIALGGTVIADLARSRDTRSRDDLAARKAVLAGARDGTAEAP